MEKWPLAMKMNSDKLFWVKNMCKIALFCHVILFCNNPCHATMSSCTPFMHLAPKLDRQRYNPNFLLFATSFHGTKKLYLVIFHWKKLTLTMFYFESACSVFLTEQQHAIFLGKKLHLILIIFMV